MAEDPSNSSEEMSQEEIDAAMSGGGDVPEETAGSDAPAEDNATTQGSDQSESFSQEEIDAALAAASGGDDSTTDSESVAPAPSDSTSTAQGDDQAAEGEGAFSQADIDAALNAAQGGESDGDESSGTAIVEPAAASEGLATTQPDGSPKLDSQGRPFDEAAAMMEAAIAEERAAAEAAKLAAASASPPAGPPAVLPPPLAGAVQIDLPDFSGQMAAASDVQGIDLINDVKLDVKIELGRSNMLIEDVLKLNEGGVVELDKLAGDPVDVLVNERLVARGEVLVLNDNFCVRISEILADADGEALAQT